MKVELPSQAMLHPEQSSDARVFDELFDATVALDHDRVPKIQYEFSRPKEDFLRHLVRSRNVLLHGSPILDLENLDPKQANDSEKKSGNQRAVYAVTNAVLPIFYAIQDRTKISGVVRSGVVRDGEYGEIYSFALPKKPRTKIPGSEVRYIFLIKACFVLKSTITVIQAMSGYRMFL